MTKRRLTINYLSKNMLDLLHDCDCGEYGSCLPNSIQWPLALSLAEAGLLTKVDHLTFRTTDRGRARVAKVRGALGEEVRNSDG